MSEHKMITISENKYLELVKDQEWLNCLEAAGVDNWEGFGFALEIRDENKKKVKEVV